MILGIRGIILMHRAIFRDKSAITRFLTGLIVLGLLSACAAAPRWEVSGVNKSVTPAQAAADIQSSRGQVVQWGGVIVSAQNLKDATQLEVLAYPLDESGRPRQDTQPLGRFLALKNGYLETVDWSPGRLATFIGPVQATRSGAIGESHYTYPVLSIQQSYLWPKISNHSEPRFHFGIGIGLHN